MAAEIKILQGGNLLQRANIKTMKKDLKQLREADALKESEKIIKIKIPNLQKDRNPAANNLGLIKELPKIAEKEPAFKSRYDKVEKSKTPYFSETAEDKEKKSLETTQNELKKENQEMERRKEILHKKTEREQSAMIKATEYANENEKQQIFLLESQKTDLEKQAQSAGKNQEPSFIFEKNKILREQKSWQEKLNPLIEEEKKIEIEQKTMEGKENQTNVPSERQELEKVRWNLEDQRQKIEKKRWSIEQNLSKLENKIKELDENYKKFSLGENELKNKIAEIDNSLRDIYFNITERETERIKNSMEEQKSASLRKVEIDLKEQKIKKQQQMESSGIKEKEYFKGIAPAEREKLAQSVKIEEEQRRKFMEDVEKWAQHIKNEENKT